MTHTEKEILLALYVPAILAAFLIAHLIGKALARLYWWLMDRVEKNSPFSCLVFVWPAPAGFFIFRVFFRYCGKRL